MPPAAKPAGSFVRRLIGRIVFWIIAFLFILWLVVFVLQRKFLFPRDAAVQNPQAMQMVRNLEQVWIDTPEGKVEAWFMPAPGRGKDNPGPAVIFAHGNAELIDDQPQDMEAYRRMGISVLLCEYRGYGRSAGSPSQAAITEDFKQFHAWLIARPEINPSQLIYHGRSLGGGAVCALASHHPPAMMILESSFKSAKARFAAFGIPAVIVRDPFDNLAVVRNLDRPLLLFHGRQDNIIPHSDSVALHAAAKNATLISLDCGHNDLPPDSEAYWGHIETFLKSGGLVP